MSVLVGEIFVDFSLPNQKGETVHLSDFKGKWVVLFVYPKDDTPGCTIEAQAFSKNVDRFTENGAVVLGISADDVNSHKDFCNKYDLTVDLLSDPEGHLLSALGVTQSEYEGTVYWDRTTFLVDGFGVLRKIYSNVQPKGHDEAVLEEIIESRS